MKKYTTIFAATVLVIGLALAFKQPSIHAQSGCIAGQQCDIGPSDLGISGLAVTGGGGKAFGNLIDTRGFSNFYFMHQCSSGPYDIRFRMIDADGVVQTANTIVTNVPAGVEHVTTFGIDHDPAVVSGQTLVATPNPQFKIRGPFRAVQLGFQDNNAAPMTCDASLIMQ